MPGPHGMKLIIAGIGKTWRDLYPGNKLAKQMFILIIKWVHVFTDFCAMRLFSIIDIYRRRYASIIMAAPGELGSSYLFDDDT